MALDLDILNGHLDRVFTDFTLTVYWQGKAISAVRSQPTMMQTLEVGGPEQKVEFDLFLRASDLQRIPHEGDMMTVLGTQMRVVSVRRASETGELIACSMGYLRQGDYP